MSFTCPGGAASYDNELVAQALVDLLASLDLAQVLGDRYDLEVGNMSGEDYIIALGDHRYKGDKERAAVTLLNDFRKGNLGALPLELPA